MELEFRGQYNKNILFRAISLLNRPTSLNTLFRLTIFVAFTVLYLSLTFSVFQDEDRSSVEVGRVIRHLFTLLFLGYIALQPFVSSYFTASRLWNAPGFRKPILGKITAEGIQSLQSNSNDIIKWDKFVKVRITDEIVVLLIASGFPLILHRSFFNNNDWNKFHQMIRYKVLQAI